MASWSSIRDKAHAFYHRWKAEIQIYGLGLLLTFSGFATGRDKAAAIVFCITILYDLMRRFGEPYRALGEQEYARRQQVRQKWWREQTEDLLSRFIVPRDLPDCSSHSSWLQQPCIPAEPGLEIAVARAGRPQDLHF